MDAFLCPNPIVRLCADSKVSLHSAACIWSVSCSPSSSDLSFIGIHMAVNLLHIDKDVAD